MESLHTHPSNPDVVFGVNSGRWYGRHLNNRRWFYLGTQSSIDDALHKYMKMKAPKNTQTYRAPDFIELTNTNGWWYGRLTDAPQSMAEIVDKNVDLNHFVHHRRRLGRANTYDEALAKYRRILGIAEPPEVTMPTAPKRSIVPDVPPEQSKRRRYEQRNGVYQRACGKFVASIQKHHVNFYLGIFDTMEEAHRAMDKYKPLITEEVVNSKEMETRLRDMIQKDRKGRRRKGRSGKRSSISSDSQVSSPDESETLGCESNHVEQSATHCDPVCDDDLLASLTLEEIDALIAM